MSPPADKPVLPVEGEAPAETEPADLCLTISAQDGDWPDVANLETAIREAAAVLARHPAGQAARCAEATIVLGSDALLRRLNGAFRGKDMPTNVLAFPFRPRAAADRQGSPYLGDVVLAAETIAREAAQRRLEPIHHVQHLVVHGLLHLLGYDHESDPQADEMEGLETEILTALGRKDPHAVFAPSD
jgi:probable rRNA maturation factor